MLRRNPYPAERVQIEVLKSENTNGTSIAKYIPRNIKKHRGIFFQIVRKKARKECGRRKRGRKRKILYSEEICDCAVG